MDPVFAFFMALLALYMVLHGFVAVCWPRWLWDKQNTLLARHVAGEPSRTEMIGYRVLGVSAIIAALALLVVIAIYSFRGTHD
jgi:hypothetical protein